MSQLVGMRFLAVLAAALLAGVASGDDDGASACGKCQSTIAVLQEEWTNATEVAEILASLEQNCTATFGRLHPLKVGLCDKVAEVFVQIPPGIFQGLETLAWPIPLGVCATIGECETPCWTSFFGGYEEFEPYEPVPQWLQPLVDLVSRDLGA